MFSIKLAVGSAYWLVLSSSAFAQVTVSGSWSFGIFNRGCETISARWDAFAVYSGIPYYCGGSTVGVPSGQTVVVSPGFAISGLQGVPWDGGWQVATAGCTLSPTHTVCIVGELCTNAHIIPPVSGQLIFFNVTNYVRELEPLWARQPLAGGGFTNKLWRFRWRLVPVITQSNIVVYL